MEDIQSTVMTDSCFVTYMYLCFGEKHAVNKYMFFSAPCCCSGWDNLFYICSRTIQFPHCGSHICPSWAKKLVSDLPKFHSYQEIQLR